MTTNTTEKIPIALKWTMGALRNRSGLSQNEASKALGVSIPKLKKWEDDSSTMNFKDIKKASDLYHIPTDYIFFGSKLDLIERLKEEGEK